MKLTTLFGLTHCRLDEAELFGNHELDEMAQSVAAPAIKTKLNSKTNMAALTGGVGVVASQADTIGNVMDKVSDNSKKGGDFADQFGAIVGDNWVPLIAVGVVGLLLCFIISERNKKVDEYGL